MFGRNIRIRVKDGNDELLKGSRIDWFVNGTPVGSVIDSDGHADITLKDTEAVVSVRASYRNEEAQEVKLARDVVAWEFKFPGVVQNPRWRHFAMKYFPALVGIAFILLAVTLVFVFNQPNALQTRIVLALFALGGGGFGGQIAGFIKADIKIGQQIVVSAGGAAAIFVILFFAVPAG